MEATVDGLQKKTVYVLRVAGLSGGGDGQMSDPVYFTILGKYSKICVKRPFKNRQNKVLNA